ncbi:MAG: hypothetical protein ACREA7_08415 [Nitrosotalea sp.]
MKINSFSIAIMLASIITVCTLTTVPNAFATTWYPGENLKQGDYYRYTVGDVNWHNGAQFEMDFWVKNQTNNNINLEMVVNDGAIVQKGIVTIGLVTPDPVGYSPNMVDYANVYKLTLGWLDAFSTHAAPIDVLGPVWGRAGLFGEVTIGSVGYQTVTTQAGTFKASAIYFRDSGVDSYLWVDPTLPFPVKALVYAIKTSGAPTIGFQFEMLEHGNSQQPPAFLNVQSTGILGSSVNCPTPDFGTDIVHNTVSTDSNSMNIEYMYSPAVVHQGCPIDMRLSFEPKYSAVQRISDVHYDIYAVDDKGKEISSFAQNLGRTDIYAAVGDDEQTFVETQPPTIVHYLVNVVGTGPQSGFTDSSKAGLVSIDVAVAPPFAPSSTSTNATTPGIMNTTSSTQSTVIPAWIKNNAGWWSSGQIGDDQFVQGLQYMIQHGIIQIPAQSGSTAATSGTQQIPAWIKNNAGWWSSGQIGDDQFVQGLQYMITSGIIKINS